MIDREASRLAGGRPDLKRVPEGHKTRLRYGKGLRGRFLITLHDEAAAETRAIRMRDLATMLGRAGHSGRAPIILEEAGKAPTEKDFAEAVTYVEALCAGKGKPLKVRPTKKRTADDDVHDLRGVFCTVSLADGKTESWITDRTGWQSSAMVGTYKRMARTFGELDLGPLTPLDEAIPELREAPEGSCRLMVGSGR